MKKLLRVLVERNTRLGSVFLRETWQEGSGAARGSGAGGAEVESHALILRGSPSCSFLLSLFLASGELAHREVNKIMVVVKRHNYFIRGFICGSLPAIQSYKPRKKKKRKRRENIA